MNKNILGLLLITGSTACAMDHNNSSRNQNDKQNEENEHRTLQELYRAKYTLLQKMIGENPKQHMPQVPNEDVQPANNVATQPSVQDKQHQPKK